MSRVVRTVLLDVEGTTTSVRFVYDVLFPYAREHVTGFLEASGDDPDVLQDVRLLREERSAEPIDGQGPPAWDDGSAHGELRSVTRYASWLMERDRKSTGLKSLQGKIWEQGYREGRLEGHVYDDVLPAFRRWAAEGRSIGIFSSGSVLAQKLLFSHTTAGDLTRWIDRHFDTTTGPKKVTESYGRIASALGQPVESVLFVSDVQEELDAARDAGMRTALCVREGEPPRDARHPVVRDLDAIPHS